MKLAYSVPQAAEVLGVSTFTVRQWISEGRIPVLKLPNGNRRVLIAAADLEQFVAELERVAAPEPDAAMQAAAQRRWRRAS